MPAGQKLKCLRSRCNITVREVEQASRRIAGVKGDKRFFISNGWLAQLENGISEPGICKLFSLSVIYQENFLNLVRYYDLDVNGNGRSASSTLHTQLSSIIYGHLGSSDFTMYPLIRPGAQLKIDTSQNRLSEETWRNEYERPIFLVELREAYACGWCELQGDQLLIIPHPSSPVTVRRFAYPREADIVGRVVSYSTDCVDPESYLEDGHRRHKKVETLW